MRGGSTDAEGPRRPRTVSLLIQLPTFRKPDLPGTLRPARLWSGPRDKRGLERVGTITSRQSHPISYPALPEGAFTVLAVREVGPADAPKPRLPDRVRD